MSSMSGYISYINYVAGTTRDGIEAGKTQFNGVFGIGDMTEGRQNYTSNSVTETFTATDSQTDFVLAWYPVGTVSHVYDNNVETTEFTVDKAAHTLKLNAGATAGHTIKVAYTYDNIYIPQNDIPLLNAKVESIALVAKARRIAVYYSQMAAFQAKTDYGFDLGDQLAEQAAGELAYEIDSEVVNLLINSAPDAEDYDTLTFNTAIPVGISKAQHYEGFAEIVEKARAIVYNRTRKFMPNYMIVGADMIPVLTFVTGFKPATVSVVAGPYFAGTLNGMKVFVSPMLTKVGGVGKFVIGVNGNDMMTSAAVYAPYMPIVPTQLLQYADGGTSQGFSTMYALELLSHYTDKNGRTVSPLLVRGTIKFDGDSGAQAPMNTESNPVYTKTVS